MACSARAVWLLGIYGHREFDPELPADAAALAACQHFHEALKSLANLPESLTPAVNAVQALRLALDQVERKLIPPLRTTMRSNCSAGSNCRSTMRRS